MTWVKLDDGFAGHPKMEAVGPLAAWLHVAGLCHCAQYLTDGEIVAVKARKLADVPRIGQQIAKLVAEGVWHEPGHDCPECPPCPDGHYLVHAYLEFQRSRADVLAERAAAAERQRRARDKSRRESRRDNGDRHAVSHGGSHAPPDPTRPDPTRPTSVDTSSETHTPSGDTVCPAVAVAIEIEVGRRFEDRVAKGVQVGNRTSYLASIRDAVHRECAPAFGRIVADVPDADPNWIIAEYDRRTELGGVA